MNRKINISTFLLIMLFCFKSYALNFIVTNTADTMTAGTLRTAITNANAAVGSHNITFGIAGANPVINITAGLPLPPLARQIAINGSNTGAGGGGGIVTINGNGAVATGFNIGLGGSLSTISNFSIINFTSQGIQIAGDNITISNNRIGVNAAGTTAAGNGQGILVSSSGNAAIISGNIISGNINNGINWTNQSNGPVITGNIIGLDSTGNIAIPNGTGINTSGALNVTISNNTISGNTGTGINMTGINSTFSITGNRIGTNSAGLLAVPNNLGISISNFSGLNPGTITNNTISGNTTNGITLNNADNITIQGNRIGVSASSNPLGNGNIGINLINASSNNKIGGTTAGQSNTIANNPAGGIQVNGALTNRNAITRNSIFNNNNAGILLLNNGNAAQQPPIIEGVCYTGTTLTVKVTTPAIADAPSASVMDVQFFASDSANQVNEGRIYLGQVTGQLPLSPVIFSTIFPTPSFSPFYVSATAIVRNGPSSAPGDTSQFSASVTPFAISISPAIQVVCPNGDINFSAIPTSQAITSYTWTGPNGFTENTGTIPNLTIPNATAADAGSYSVSTTSSVPALTCLATSAPAQVVINSCS